MKRILFLFSLLPYLASAQVAKDTVTVLTPAQITAASPNDTANIYFVIANAWRKANFDSIARYTRTRLQTLTLDSTHIAASGLNLQGTRFTGVLPATRGGTGQSSLTANKVLVGNGTSGVLQPTNLHWDNSNFRLGIGQSTPLATLHLVAPQSAIIVEKQSTSASATGPVFYVTDSGQISSGASNSEFTFFVAGAGSTSNVDGPNFVMRGNTFSRALNQRGYMLFLAGEPTGTITGNDGVLRFASTSSLIDFVTGSLFSSRLTILNNGNVGVGVTDPASRFQVNGVSAFANGSAGAPSMTNTGNTDTGMWFPAADVVGFSTSGTERMRVKANGQVRFIPLGAAPGSPELGDVYYDSGTHKLRVYAKVGGTDQWVDLH